MNDWIAVAMAIFAVGTVVAVYATGMWAKPIHAKGSVPGTKVSAALGAILLAALLGGCADSSICRSGSTVAGVSQQRAIVGCGGPYDEVDRELYQPGSRLSGW
jgi:hypothetical protein